MVDDVKDILETAENKGSADAVERARLARERREAEQRRRLDELRAHAAAAQAQREKRDEERRRRQEEQRSKDTDRRHQVEERKRAIWEASISRREALLQREKDREERLERARQARSSPRSAFAFGSSTPRLLEPADTSGFFWAARRASSTSNVMYASAPLTRRASALQLDMCDNDNKDEIDRPAPVMWNSVARRRTDLVPTLPASRAPEGRSGDSTPGSRPGSAMSVSTPGPVPGVIRRPQSARRPRPASIAGTGVNTPRGGLEGGASLSTTPSVSRDASSTNMRPASTPRRVRPVSVHLTPSTPTTHRPALTPGEGKPPIQRKPKLSKEHEKSPRNIAVKARSVSPGRPTNTPSPHQSKDSSVDKDIVHKKSSLAKDKAQVNATEVTQKLEALQINSNHNETVDDKDNREDVVKVNEKVQPVVNNTIAEESLVDINNRDDEHKSEPTTEVVGKEERIDKKEVVKEKKEEVKEKKEDIKEKIPEKLEDNEMTASMTARRITTEEEAKAALAERRRKAREELERQAELERHRLEQEAERQAQLQKEEEERQRKEEDEARELAALQRQMQEEKLRKAIEAQQQLEREEAEKKAREEAEKIARLKEEEEKRKAAEEAEKLRKEEAEREEKERIARKQRVEAIMARTRLRKTDEDKKPENKNSAQNTQNSNPTENTQASTIPDGGNENNGNSETRNNGNVAIHTEDLLGLSQNEVSVQSQETSKLSSPESTNGNIHNNVTHMTANFIQNEIAAEQQKKDVPQIEDGDFTTHNGHGNNHTHPLTVQNAI